MVHVHFAEFHFANWNSASRENNYAAAFSWWKRLGPMSTERPATTGNGHLPLVSDLTSPAKRRNSPRDPIPESSSQASVRN